MTTYKLLHERAREAARAAEPDGPAGTALLAPYGVITRLALDDLAEEIENRYCPLPCDADGEPWREGDLCTSPGEPSRTFEVTGFGRNGLVEVTDSDDVDFTLWLRPDEICRPDSFGKAMGRLGEILWGAGGIDYGVRMELCEAHRRLAALVERWGLQ